jgi:hypothetical protein
MIQTKALFKEVRKKFQSLTITKEIEDPHAAHRTHEFKMGFDSVVNGANATNSNFRIFHRPEIAKEWGNGAKFARDLITEKLKRESNEV